MDPTQQYLLDLSYLKDLIDQATAKSQELLAISTATSKIGEWQSLQRMSVHLESVSGYLNRALLVANGSMKTDNV